MFPINFVVASNCVYSSSANIVTKSLADAAYPFVAKAASKTRKYLAMLYDRHLEQEWNEVFLEKKGLKNKSIPSKFNLVCFAST